MSLSIVKGTNDKPAASLELVDALQGNSALSGGMFIGFPIFPGSDGPHRIDALLVSPDKGIIAFNLVEGPDLGEYGLRQDDAANVLESLLKRHRELMRRRDPLVPVRTVTFRTKCLESRAARG